MELDVYSVCSEQQYAGRHGNTIQTSSHAQQYSGRHVTPFRQAHMHNSIQIDM
jgi:hypothetical protein